MGMPQWVPRPFKSAAGWIAGKVVGFMSDQLATEGAATLPYAIENVRVEYTKDDPGIPTGFWRSVGHSQNAFIVESFIDELANANQQDPLEFRRNLLRDKSRHSRVLDLVAEKAGWNLPLPVHTHRGVAIHESFGSVVAQVVEITVSTSGAIKVHRVVCVVDCGIAVNPNTITAQMESGIAFGLSATLKSAITLNNGRVEQSNFHDFPVLRMHEMPTVEVHIVPSSRPPAGIGEPGVPPIGPAVANAVFAATGIRIRHLPIKPEDIVTRLSHLSKDRAWESEPSL